MRQTVLVATIGDGQAPQSASSPLAALRYSRAGHDLVRFVSDPLDDTIANIVASAWEQDDDQRTALRSVLTTDDCYTLITFSKRRTVAALRSGALLTGLEAIWALTLIDRAKVDYRDLSVDFPLFAVRELGGDLTDVITLAVAASEPGTSSCFSAKAERSRTLTAKDCALFPVRSHYGLGFMNRWNADYQPDTNLAELSILLADAIEAEGQYSIDDLHISQLPEEWFYQERRTGHIPTEGCVGLGAHLNGAPRYSHGLIVFAAQVRDESVVSKLSSLAAAASSTVRPRVAAIHDRRIVLIVGGSTTRGEPTIESTDSLSRYAGLASRLLESDSV
jgi:hypothetical protein